MIRLIVITAMTLQFIVRLQLIVTMCAQDMETCVWWEAMLQVRVEWRCVSMVPGAQCVITPGTQQIPRWSASSWGIMVVSVAGG